MTHRAMITDFHLFILGLILFHKITDQTVPRKSVCICGLKLVQSAQLYCQPDASYVSRVNVKCVFLT